jgi:hypothetical protein
MKFGSSVEFAMDETALFWDITQRMVEIPYRLFGTTCESNLKGQKIQEESR